MNELEVNQAEVIQSIKSIMTFCQDEGMSELVAYMAMISITKTMEDNLGFGHESRRDS